MKHSRTAAVALALVAFAAASAQAQTQTVTFAVNAINQIAFTGAPSLTITTAVAGAAPTAATDASAKWAVTCNQTGAKISASTPAMPAGLTLSVNLTAPAVGSSLGLTAIGTTATDLVTGITKTNGSNLGVTYQLDATVAAGVVTSSTRLVTYTITGGT